MATPAEFGQPGLGLGKVTRPDGPLPEQDGDKGIGKKADQHERHHGPFSEIGLGLSMGVRVFHSAGLTGRRQGLQVDLA